MNDLKEQQDEINQFFRDRSMDDVDDDVEEEMNKLIESTKSDIEQELPSANTNEIVVDDGNKNINNKEKITELI